MLTRIFKALSAIFFVGFIFMGSLHIFSVSLEVDLKKYLSQPIDRLFKKSFEATSKFHVVNQYGLFRRFLLFFFHCLNY